MFIGHFGLSFAAKKVAPKVSLATLFIATQFVDILWLVLVMAHVEKVAIVPGHTKMNAFDFLYFPYTHTLLMGLVWGILCGGLYVAIKKDRRGGIVIGLCVLSHWLIDLIVHAGDHLSFLLMEQKQVLVCGTMLLQQWCWKRLFSWLDY